MRRPKVKPRVKTGLQIAVDEQVAEMCDLAERSWKALKQREKREREEAGTAPERPAPAIASAPTAPSPDPAITPMLEQPEEAPRRRRVRAGVVAVYDLSGNRVG